MNPEAPNILVAIDLSDRIETIEEMTQAAKQ